MCFHAFDSLCFNRLSNQLDRRFKIFVQVYRLFWLVLVSIILIYKKTRVFLQCPDLRRRMRACARRYPGDALPPVWGRRLGLHFNYQAVSLDPIQNDFTTNSWPLSTGSRWTHSITRLVWCYFNPSNNNVRFCHPLAFTSPVWGAVQENTSFPVSIQVSHGTIGRPAGPD